jgi:WD40 repeat protein/tRNA A-37 threonylcarbamoyl transferase component Bud32
MAEAKPLVMELYQRWLRSPGVAPEIICKDHPELLAELKACVGRAAGAAWSGSSPDPDATISMQSPPTTNPSPVDQSKGPLWCANGHPVAAGFKTGDTCRTCDATISMPPRAADSVTKDAAPECDSPKNVEGAPSPDAALPKAPHGYVIIKEAGKGGLGEVFEALDESLDRKVALKRIRHDMTPTPTTLHRFLVESRVTAQLEHPGIVPVHSAGDDHGPYYTMKLIQGKTLWAAVKEHHQTSRGTSRELLRRFIGVCQAVEFAHSRGVIHRDIKPSNIMLGNYGETILLDWGLAKSHDGLLEEAVDEPQEPDSGMDVTRVGECLGTLNYMPPEQMRGALAEHGTTSDVYALGAVLFFILNNASPGGVKPPNLPQVSKALAAIARKAMAHARADRYPSAAALAHDVQHWLDDEPVSVHQDPWSVQLFRWMKRHRTMVTAASAVIVLGVSAILINNVLVRREQQRTAAEERRTRRELARSNIAEADALAAGAGPVESLKRIQQASEILAGLHEPADPAILAALNVVWRNGSPSLSAADAGPRFRDAAIAPGRAEALAVGDDGLLRYIHLPTSQATTMVLETGELMSAVGVAPRGDVVAVGTTDGAVRLIHYRGSGIWPAAVPAHSQNVIAVRFSPGGSVFATLGGDGSVWLWRPEAATGMHIQLPGNERAKAIAFSSEARLVVAHAGGFYMFMVGAAAPTVIARGKGDQLTAIAASGDGSRVITGDMKGVIRRWKEGGDETEFALHAGKIYHIALSPDATKAWYSAQEGRCGLLDLETGDVVQTLAPVSGAPVNCLDVDWESGLALTVVKSNSIWILESWNLRGNPLEKPLDNSQQAEGPVAFSDSGTLLMGLKTDGSVGVWDLGTGFELLPLGGVAKETLKAGLGLLSADGAVALPPTETYSTSSESKARVAPVYSTKDGRVKANLTELADASQFRALSPDGKKAATIIGAKIPVTTLGIWTIAAVDKGPVARIDLEASPVTGAFSADGRWLAVGLENGQTVLVDAGDGTHQTFGGSSSPVRSICFVGERDIVVAHRDGTLCLWSPAHPSKNHSVAAHQGDISKVVCAERGNLLFSAGRDGKLCIWTKDLDRVRAITIGTDLELLAINPTGECLVFRAASGITALHLDFARRLVEANVGHMDVAGDKRFLRYLALGRSDWFLETIPGGTTPGVSEADKARALWAEGRLADAKNAFSKALIDVPAHAADLQACLRKLQGISP